MKIAERRVAQWSKHGAPVIAALTRRGRAHHRLRRAGIGGWTNPTGGHINPLALARGLAAGRAAPQGGGSTRARRSAVLQRRGAFWFADTPRGADQGPRAGACDQRLYGRVLDRRWRPTSPREVVPVYSWQMATQPLSDNVRQVDHPGAAGGVGYAPRALFRALRSRAIGWSPAAPCCCRGSGRERMQPYIAARLERLFPQIGPVAFDYVWNGYCRHHPRFLSAHASARARRLRLGRLQRPRRRARGRARAASWPRQSQARRWASWRCR